jgi:hypothetical protein
VEFSATALGGETTRAFLLFIPKLRRKRAKVVFSDKKFRLTAKGNVGEKIFKKCKKGYEKGLTKGRSCGRI